MSALFALMMTEKNMEDVPSVTVTVCSGLEF
jgi:hypothetical protein